MVHDLYRNAKHLNTSEMLLFFNRMSDIDITEWLPQIQTPTLVVAGDSDMIVPSAQARLIAEKVRNSTLHMIQGVGHLPMNERPDEYHKIVTDWLLAINSLL
jgi:pimeloyl-ACP methyl ester carboxylesterase